MSKDEHNVSGRHDVRPTIAYLAPEVAVGTTPMAIWSGVVAGAQEHDLNLIGIVGGNIMEGQANIVYDLVTPESCKGIVTWSMARGSFDQENEAIHARYQALPMVTVTRAVAGHPVVADQAGKGLFIQVTQLSGGTRVKGKRTAFRWHVSVNNPLDRAVSVRLRQAMRLPGLRFGVRKFTLKPGEYRVQLSGVC